MAVAFQTDAFQNDAFQATLSVSAGLTGAGVSSAAGTVSATGGASADVSGAIATSAAGTFVASGDASADLVGAIAPSAAGVFLDEGDSNVGLLGAGMQSAAGTLSAIGEESVPDWSLQITGFPQVRPRGAIASVRGVSARARSGALHGSGSATVRLPGDELRIEAGAIDAFGMDRVFPREPFTRSAATVLRGWSTATVYRRRKPQPMRAGNGCD
jgi:hypothetical protein